MPLTLYDAPDCWKCVEVKDALDALGLAYEAVTVRGNPGGAGGAVAAQGEPPQVPMLVDGDVAVWDRRRILAYLAETYGDGPRRGDVVPGHAVVRGRHLPGRRGGDC